jgi:hypothetical protein
MDTNNRHIHHSKAFDQILGRIASCEDWAQLECITGGIDDTYTALGLLDGELELIIHNARYRAMKIPESIAPDNEAYAAAQMDERKHRREVVS